MSRLVCCAVGTSDGESMTPPQLTTEFTAKVWHGNYTLT